MREQTTNTVSGLTIDQNTKVIVLCLDKLNYDIEQIVERIEKFDLQTRLKLHMAALEVGNEDLADKIGKANEIIEQKCRQHAIQLLISAQDNSGRLSGIPSYEQLQGALGAIRKVFDRQKCECIFIKFSDAKVSV